MMFPSGTLYNRRIPKNKFYENISATAEIKRLFADQIDSIVWQNKLSPGTLNVETGRYVKEIEVFRVLLNQSGDRLEKILRLIDESIPYHLVFLLNYKDLTAIWIGYKEIDENRHVNKVFRYFSMGPKPENELELPLSGISMDIIYENMIKYVAGKALVWKEGGYFGDRSCPDAGK
jgi:hypothetical protein